MSLRNNKISVFKDLFKSKDVPYIISLEKSLERIRVGKSKHLIDKIRNGNKELKNKLPSILFSGVFSERNSKSLEEHSGLMILDFDKYPSKSDMDNQFKELTQNKHIVSVFVSPSGNGLKAVLRVSNELSKETHPKVFKAFQNEFKYDYFDISNSNVDRVCFESYDPNIYINYDAEVFSPVIMDDGFERITKVPTIPIENEDVIIEKIMNWNWQKDFVEGQRNSFIFDIAGAFCEYGITQDYAEGYILNNVSFGNFSDKEVRTAIRSAYKSRSFNSKFFEDYNKINRVKRDLPKGKKSVIKTHKIDETTYDIIQESNEHDEFWYFDNKGKPKIDSLKYKWFLERNGYKKYFPSNSQKPTWVSIQSNIVRETSVEKIKDFVLNYLLDRSEFDVWRYCSNYGNIFSENFLLMLDSIELQMLKDEKNKSFIAYQNGILEITANQANLIEYIDIDGYVWESQIIKRDYKNLTNNDNEYKTFINNISNNEPLAMECSIGYLLSTYKNKMNNKAIILNDEVISDNPEGGTGKGLFVQGLRQIRKVAILDGKSHDDKKSFPYQTVSQDSQIIVFDDVKRNFDFESKFSLVTEGITIERKNKDAIKLSVEESPKMVISTNYSIKGEGNSHDRRRHEMEIAQYYGKDKTPYDEFEKQLFDDWNDDTFLKFDNYMVYCIQAYLKNGLITQTAKNIKMRKFIAETAMEFYEWITDTEFFQHNKRHTKSEVFDQFTKEYPDFNKWLTRKRFNIWIKKYASFMDYRFNEGITQGERWLEVIDNNPVVETELADIDF